MEENGAYRGCSVSLSAADRCCSVLARQRLDEKEEEEVKKNRSINRKLKSKMKRSDDDGLRSSFQSEIHDEGCYHCC